MEREPVEDGAHRMFPNAEVQVTPSERSFAYRVGCLDLRLTRWVQVRRTSDHLGQKLGYRIDDRPRRRPGRRPLGTRFNHRQGIGPILGQTAFQTPTEGLRCFGIALGPNTESFAPCSVGFGAATGHFPAPLGDGIRHKELLFFRPTQILLGAPDFFHAEWCTVGPGRVLLSGGRKSNMGSDRHQGRSFGLISGGVKGRGQSFKVVGVFDAHDVPAVGLESSLDIIGNRQIGRSLNRDPVVVPDPAQL